MDRNEITEILDDILDGNYAEANPRVDAILRDRRDAAVEASRQDYIDNRFNSNTR